LQVEFFKVRPNAQIPKLATSGSVGFDFAAAENIKIEPKQISKIPTGISIAVPKGFALVLASRSSAPKKFHLSPPHGIGIIDQDFCGPKDEIQILVYNFSDFVVKIFAGDRIAQGIFVPVLLPKFIETNFSNKKNRGGFGSTG